MARPTTHDSRPSHRPGSLQLQQRRQQNRQVHRSGPNLQQLPSAKAPDFKPIVAAPGCVLVAGDWTQIEMRAAAWISRDPALTAVYEQGRDLHTETAALVAGVPSR